MSNSLNFLNKPATPAKVYGPQPKPAGSTAAPKSAFLDKSNPWAVGGGTPTASAKSSAPKTQTPARANVPSRGYSYTDGSYTGATPQQRAREVDQAQMSAQATRQRKERERQAAAQAQAQAAPPPLKVQARESAQNLPPAPPPWAGPQVAEQPPIGLYMPTPQQTRQAAAQQSLLSRAANAWLNFATGAPPQPAYNPLPQNAPAPQQRAQPQAPVAPPAQQAGAQPAAPATPPTLPAPPTPAANVPQAAGTPPATTTGADPRTLFYGYPAPGPLVVDRRERIRANLQGGEQMPWVRNPWEYTTIGIQALESDAALAARDAGRQREANQPYRPWSSLTDAEKYQRRFGVMPTGPQMTPDYSSGIAAQAASAAQQERLIDEYWQNYGNITNYNNTGRGVRSPMGSRYTTPLTGTNPIQRGPSGQAAGAAPATPVTVTTTGTWRPTPGVSQEQLNNSLLEQVNPTGYKAGKVPVDDVNRVAQEIIKRYAPGINPSIFTLTDIAILMRDAYTPPPGLEQAYGDDLKWLAARIPSEQ